MRRVRCRNAETGARRTNTRTECKDMYILHLPESFLLGIRYLFLWFGFDASEFTCANLGIKGDQFPRFAPRRKLCQYATRWFCLSHYLPSHF